MTFLVIFLYNPERREKSNDVLTFDFLFNLFLFHRTE